MTDSATGHFRPASVTMKPGSERSEANPSLSIFAIPKPFNGRDDIIQRNAIGSWLRLTSADEIFLFGEAHGTARVAQEVGVRHSAKIQCNEFGTPRVSEAFAGAAAQCRGELLMYANADVIFQSDLTAAIARLQQHALGPFLAIGRRVNAFVDRLIDWQQTSDLIWLSQRCAEGRRESILCKDYFVYPRGWFTNLPPFAVGRGNWDNWMVYAAKQMRMKVIDVSLCVTAIHQDHNHDHVVGGQRAAYVHGAEARTNQRLAGGRHWIRGSTPTWVLRSDRLVPRRFAGLQMAFWADLPRAARLGWQMLRPR